MKEAARRACRIDVYSSKWLVYIIDDLLSGQNVS